jgi:type IV pilus assembly protein PilN
MIKINLLPHREEKRKQKKAAFVALMIAGALAGATVVLLVGGYNASRISIQEQRNQALVTANADLDKKIAEIATLRQEIDALQARQQAVEDLQADRNQPVTLLDELVRQTPDGVYLKSFRQDAQRVQLTGVAQSQERVAELLRNFAGNSVWMERPELGEVKAVALAGSKNNRKVVEFSMVVGIKRPRGNDADQPDDAAGKAKAAAKASAAAKKGP